MTSSILSTTASFSKMRNMFSQHKVDDDKNELLKTKQEWRSLQNNEMFQDFLFLRDAIQTKLAVEIVENRKMSRKASIILPFLKQQQIKKLESARKLTQITSLSQLNDLTPTKGIITDGQQNQNLHNIQIMLQELIQKVLIDELEQLQGILEKLVQYCKQSGIVTFYFLAIYFQTQIQFTYCRRKDGYGIWKRFLRTCNLQGKKLQKYKLLAYRQLARCALDLGSLDKQAIYLKKLLKLSWVVKDRNYELLCYDMIAMNCYYKGDIERAQFFHNKFVKGEYESLESSVRLNGITAYLGNQKLKSQMNDQDSFSIDDMDFDILIQEDNIKKWQKGLPVFDNRNVQQHRVIINQWSCNRDLTIHLINKEKQKNKESIDVGFVPLNTNIRRLLKLFYFDIKYFIKNGTLCDFL